MPTIHNCPLVPVLLSNVKSPIPSQEYQTNSLAFIKRDTDKSTAIYLRPDILQTVHNYTSDFNSR